jgi:hypothetical protein
MVNITCIASIIQPVAHPDPVLECYTTNGQRLEKVRDGLSIGLGIVCGSCRRVLCRGEVGHVRCRSVVDGHLVRRSRVGVSWEVLGFRPRLLYRAHECITKQENNRHSVSSEEPCVSKRRKDWKSTVHVCSAFRIPNGAIASLKLVR